MARVPPGIPAARSPHQGVHQPADRIAGSHETQGTAGRHRKTARHGNARLTLGRQLVAEGLGSLLLAAAVIGSGIMAERLAGGNAAIALLANTAATVAALG